jgi:hypothetical protein
MPSLSRSSPRLLFIALRYKALLRLKFVTGVPLVWSRAPTSPTPCGYVLFTLVQFFHAGATAASAVAAPTAAAAETADKMTKDRLCLTPHASSVSGGPVATRGRARPRRECLFRPFSEGLLDVEDGQELLKTCRDVAGECVFHCLDLSIVEREMDVVGQRILNLGSKQT